MHTLISYNPNAIGKTEKEQQRTHSRHHKPKKTVILKNSEILYELCILFVFYSLADSVTTPHRKKRITKTRIRNRNSNFCKERTRGSGRENEITTKKTTANMLTNSEMKKKPFTIWNSHLIASFWKGVCASTGNKHTLI